MFSLIIPCYNCSKYIEENLLSIRNQSYTSWECLIIDDGSTDDSSVIIKNFIKDDKRFKYIYQENKGLSAARNTGARNSIYDLLLFIDADDYISSDFLKKAIPIFEQPNEIHVGFVNFCVFGEDSSYIRYYNGGTTRQMLIEKWLPGAGIIMKREVWSRVGGYSEDDLLRKGCEDVDFWVKNTAFPLHTQKIDDVLYYYRRHEGSMVTHFGKDLDKLYRYIVEKNKDIYSKDKKVKNKFLSRGYFQSAHYFYLNQKYIKAIYLTVISIYLSRNDKNSTLLKKCFKNFLFNK